MRLLLGIVRHLDVDELRELHQSHLPLLEHQLQHARLDSRSHRFARKGRCNLHCQLAHKIIANWGLSLDKCAVFQRDGGANIVKACDNMGVKSLSCAAHSLHLVVGAVLVRKLGETLEEDWCFAGNTNNQPGRDQEESQDLDFEVEEVISDADIEHLCSEVATFVRSSRAYRADLETVRTIVQRFRKLAVYFHGSQKGANRLKQLQGDIAIPLKVYTDCPTRWGSTLVMLQRLIELRSALGDFFIYLGDEGADEFSVTRSRLRRPTSEEWFTIQCLVELWGPFSAIQEELGTNKYPTLISTLPAIRSLRSMLQDEHIFTALSASVQGEEFESRVRELMESVRRNFVVLLDKRFSEINEELLRIPLLDPRFTNTELLTTSERASAASRIVDEMFATAKASMDANDSTHEPTPLATHDHPTPKKKMRVAFYNLMYGTRTLARPQTTFDRDRVLIEECKWEYNKYIQDGIN